MRSLTRWFAFLIILLACALSVSAQTSKAPPVSTAFAILSTALDTKTSAGGDEIVMMTVSDILVDGRIVVPKGSKILGHIGGLVTKGKDEPKTVLAIAIDKAVSKGIELPLQAIIVAVAAPQKSLPEDPTYGMMHSNEPKMIGSGVGVANAGNLPASSKASSTATVATAQLKGRSDEPFLLTEDSQGALGYEGVLISWHLTIPPPLTIFATKAKNLKLEAGTQMLLRMAQPRLPQ